VAALIVEAIEKGRITDAEDYEVGQLGGADGHDVVDVRIDGGLVARCMQPVSDLRLAGSALRPHEYLLACWLTGPR
jgi:hypothetical protein